MAAPEDKKHFDAIRNVTVWVDPSLPESRPAHAEIRKLTPAQKKAGVPAANIYVRPDATPEHIFHEALERVGPNRPLRVSGNSYAFHATPPPLRGAR